MNDGVYNEIHSGRIDKENISGITIVKNSESPITGGDMVDSKVSIRVIGISLTHLD